jgi:hypothetical protein
VRLGAFCVMSLVNAAGVVEKKSHQPQVLVTAGSASTRNSGGWP